jgi:hypothetical protein
LALPTDGRSFNNLLATTIDAKLEQITDDFFTRNPLVMRLLQRADNGETTVRYEGGAEIRSTILYNSLPANSYGSASTFFTGETEFLTDLVFNWKRVYAPINIDNLKLRQNMGPARVINYVEALVKNAVMSLKDFMGTMFFGDGTGNGSLNWDGLLNGVDDGTTYTTYGGITRNSTAGDPGNVIKANKNSVGGPVSLSMLQNSFGTVTFDDAKPDLIVTTQTIWNALWNRIQPQDRNAPGPLRDVGFETIRFNGAEIVVDDHCPSGSIYLLNTQFIELWLMEGMDFVRRGQDFGPNGFPVYNQDFFVDQIVCYGDLIIPGPRYQAVIQNVTA